MMTWRLSATIPVLFIMMASGFDLRAQTVIENPATPLAKNAGRVVALKEVLRIKDEGEAYYFKYPYNPYAVVKYRIDDPAAGEAIK